MKRAADAAALICLVGLEVGCCTRTWRSRYQRSR